ncbi:unnamed protein product [Staurois parvus]|uniref:Uncharacterized protein n=1 Tax=Staurois parvus TaxID=386267 RepID=A0ABN9H170_9NEOB|nr:unnamed protein product [Staurois parvus]
MGPLCLCPNKKTYEKGTRGISWGPLLTPGPRAVSEFSDGQSAPGIKYQDHYCNSRTIRELMYSVGEFSELSYHMAGFL